MAEAVRRTARDHVADDPPVRRIRPLIPQTQMRRHLVPAHGRRLPRPFAIAVVIRIEAEMRGVEFAQHHVHDADEHRVA